MQAARPSGHGIASGTIGQVRAYRGAARNIVPDAGSWMDLTEERRVPCLERFRELREQDYRQIAFTAFDSPNPVDADGSQVRQLLFTESQLLSPSRDGFSDGCEQLATLASAASR